MFQSNEMRRREEPAIGLNEMLKFGWKIWIEALNVRSAPRKAICVSRRGTTRDRSVHAVSIASFPRQMFTLNDGENDLQFFIFSRSVIKVSYNH
jgi:hypothetical protein